MGLLSLRVLTARPVCPTRGSLERRVPARVALLAIMYLMPASSARKRNAVTVQVAQRHPRRPGQTGLEPPPGFVVAEAYGLRDSRAAGVCCAVRADLSPGPGR
jgi:hypothetical protein